MCEQTEINYLDGDIVWVKLGACWWPGQVTGFHNLPEDIQIEFKKKSLIAAVKFFQEDTYEFVKNLHQIYKYNCTQKDDFIRKGLDKYRTKSKDGSSYMDKFPGDVEMAEKLTGGDPDILTSEKFGREEKPDISSLFGEKKMPKRKRERDDMQRRSEGGEIVGRKITHPRFLRESDHEIRIRQQPSSLPSTPKTPSADSPQFSCHLCNFTSTRVNVIICHRKSHCSGGIESPISRPRIIKSHAQPKSSGRPSTADTQKRKYVRKTKSLSSKGKSDSVNEPMKRKLSKQIDKVMTKKKKTDPELREKLLADWDDETDDDMDLDINKSADSSSIGSPPGKIHTGEINSSIAENKEDGIIIDDGTEIIKASEKLLRETENFSSLLGCDSSSRARQSNNKHLDDDESETDVSIITKDDKSSVNKKAKKLIHSGEERQSASSEKDEKQSRFSCFDFDEEDLPEPTITPVRKIPRIFGEKNTSVKKEILKKFTMSQALKNEKNEDEIDDKTKSKEDFNDKKVHKVKEKNIKEKIIDKRSNLDFLSGKEEKIDDKIKGESQSDDTGEKKSSSKSNLNVTELEIVEIFEVEGEKDEIDQVMRKKSDKYEVEGVVEVEKKIETPNLMEIDRVVGKKNTAGKIMEKLTRRRGKRSQLKKNYKKNYDQTISESVTTETEDDTVSELGDSLQGQHSENSDTDGTASQPIWGVSSSAKKIEGSLEDRGSREKAPPRRRGRPRKNLPPDDPSGNGDDSPKHEIISKQVAALATRDSERKTSESDSERSYSGRQRKPNKRYLHTEIYTSSPDNRGSRTDSSQSESEEKSVEKFETRTRRGKKKSETTDEIHAETMEKAKDQEFEFSNRTLDSVDRTDNIEMTNVRKIDKEFHQVDAMMEEGKLDIIETEGESSTSCTVDFMKKLDSGIGSPVNITKLLSSGDSETGSLKQNQDQEVKSEISNEAKEQEEGEIRDNIDEMEMSSDETKSSSKFDKTNIDKLPPKKSQIKKFELSQIDLLDACAEQVAAEQLAVEKIAAEKLAQEELAVEKLAAEKLAAEKLADEKLAAEKLAEEKLAAEKLAEEKLIAEKLAAEEAAEKLAAERAAEKLAAEKLAEEKIAADKLAAEKIAAEKLAAEKLAEEQEAAEKLAAEKEAADKLAAEKIAAEKLATEKLAMEKIAAEKLAAEKLAQEKLAAEKIAQEKLAAEKIAAEKLAQEKIAAEKLAEEKIAAEKLAQEKIEAEKLAEEKIAAEKLAEEKIVAEKLAAEKMAAEKIAGEKLAAEKIAAETLAAEEIAAEKLAAEEMAAEKLAAEEMAAEQQLTEETLTNQSIPSAIVEVDVPTEQIEKVIVEAVPIMPEKEDSASLMVATGNVRESSMKDSTMETIEAVLARITNEETIEETETSKETSIPSESRSIEESLKETNKLESSKMENVPTSGGAEISQRSAMQTRYKGKFTPETGTKPKKDQESADEEIPVNSFQEAFLKTLQIEPEDNKDGESSTADVSAQKVKEVASSQNVKSSEPSMMISITGSTESSFSSPGQMEDNQNLPLNAMTEFEGVEILVQDNIVETKMDESNTSTSQMDLAAALVGSDLKNDEATLSLDLQKIQDTLSDAVSTPSPPTSDINMPVKKREKPRIIENVALKEPMQILKSKLLEKIPTKSTKHKLDSETLKKGESKNSGPRAKMMKIDSPNSKSRSPTKSGGGSNFTITRKLQVLKAEEAATAAALEKEKLAAQIAAQGQMTVATSGEKFIQQSSQSLADMELDINSMPFVLSEDVLTPESIDQMPVVISSIIPSSTAPTSLTLTPTTQLMSSGQSVQYKSTSESTESTSTISTGKKKSGTPAILKNKGKGKPTITSIKTLVPPLTGGVKGLKFQSQQSTGKAMPLMTQKGTATPGKYVIVQTSGGQQMRYSVQGKPGAQQKISMPAGKAAGSAQIVQQGGKVVILTSAQSGQTKMLPLNISKSMSGKVQKIVNNKGQVYTPLSPQGIGMGAKTMIAPKTETSSPTTSKLVQGQKIINTQGIITSKGVLTPISTSKSGLLGLSSGILTKGGIYTPISSSQLAGKTIIGSKNLASKGTTILSPLGTQSLGSKTILSPMSHGLTGKTIINAQGLLTPKGTVLTPITGQQVKAIAAKSPGKGATTVSGKIPYQGLQQKLQMFQKKVPVSSSSQMRPGGSLKSPGGGSTIVFQSTTSTGQQKATTPSGKKIVRQIVQQNVRSPQTTIAQTTNPSSPQILQRGKSLTTTPTTVQRISGSPRSGGRQTKTQQKIVVQKFHEMAAGGTTSSPIMSMQTKQISAGTNIKTPSQKQTSRSVKSNRSAQKHLLNIGNLSSGTLGTSETSTLSQMPISTVMATPPLPPPPPPPPQPIIQAPPLAMPPLVIPGTELPISNMEENLANKMEKTVIDAVAQKDHLGMETVKVVETMSEAPTIETPKMAAPAQIMALPTESSDGTQTYVLVTIDEQGQIQPLDNNTLMSLEGTTQNADGTRTLYIDPSSLGEAGSLDNIVLQFDNGALPNLQSGIGESVQSIVPTESFATSEIVQTSNQDILAAALANTDFQQEIGLPENSASSVMTTSMTQTSLINQTILQSTIIPPTEPISSPSVLETSLTLNQPIMTPLEVPSSLPIQVEAAPPSVISTIPTSLELPTAITEPGIPYIATATPTTTIDDSGHVQIPGNSMPDIGEIMESPARADIVNTEIPPTRYLVIPNLNENITIQAQAVESENDSPSVTYSVSIPENIVLDNSGVQTTPSMPIIDDCYVEASEQNFTQAPVVDEILVSKTSAISTEVISTEERDRIEETEMPMKTEKENSENNNSTLSQESYVSQEIMMEQQECASVTNEMIVRDEPIANDKKMADEELLTVNISEREENCTTENMEIEERSNEIVTCVPKMEETCGSSDMNVEESMKNVIIESTNSSERQDNLEPQTPGNLIVLDTLPERNVTCHEASGSSIQQQQQQQQQQHEEGANSPSLDSSKNSTKIDGAFDSTSNLECESMPVEMEVYPEIPDGEESMKNSSCVERMETARIENVGQLGESVVTETSQEEAPSQSYEKFHNSGITSDSVEIPSQSVGKSENSGEPSQSVGYESMEIDENTISGEPPTQSFEDTKINEASQSYEASIDINTNAPTQSFNETMQCQEDGTSAAADTVDDQSFPTQSYEVGKMENISENLVSDAGRIGQEGNIPSQSNDIGNDGIGTSSVSVNNSGLNEDETASSSYVPETPENQERDQDQESAISTSSYEIPPCEELNIASSSVIPDTSVRAEHMSIHDNGVPEIPTSSYNLNPDSSSTSHVDALPTSSYEDQVIVEQNVSTSYEVPISMPGIEETSSQNFVTESSDHRNEPTSYYARHPEVTASYYETVNQDSNSRIEGADRQEEVTPSYYEQPQQEIGSEASQSYFRSTPRYTSQNVSPSYYDPVPETEASQSYYSHEIETNEQSSTSSSRNVEASQSFYQENNDEIRLRAQGEATPTYTERYPADYPLENSPIERHDLVESSVPATRPTER